MSRDTVFRGLGVTALVLLAAVVVFGQQKATFATLKDFVDVEVRGVGFVLEKDMPVTINAVGGGDKSMWREMFDEDDSPGGMYAYGWIIDAATREIVWEMNLRNTSGRRDDREFDDEIRMKAGAYEVYFAAYGYVRTGNFSYSAANIDRRGDGKHGRNYISIFGKEFGDVYEDFMELAKDTWGITLSVDGGNAGSVRTFTAPAPFKQTLFALTGVGDATILRKTIITTKDVKLRVYALGEGPSRDELFDHGWIVNSETRKRVWDMGGSWFERAGGARKNILVDTDIELEKGSYELVFVTDDSHSADDWNDRPPYDPFSYGITLFLTDESDRSAITVLDGSPKEKDVLVELTRIRDDEYRSLAFSLAKDTKVRVYALGERSGSRSMADYGWIVNAKTRRKVWSMEADETEHAGGAAKNRMIDRLITLPKGSYIVYYQSDDSHAYGDWNSSKPLEADRWGITLWAADENFDKSSLKVGEDAVSTDVIAQLIRVRDDRHDRKTFTIKNRQSVRVYALGEGSGGDMYDYGWIEDANTGRTIWEMTYRMSERAGGATKNRMVDATIVLDAGEYVLHYMTDDSHGFNDWNSDPPPDRENWGISIYRESK